MAAPTILAVEGCSDLPQAASGPGVYPPPVGEQWIRPPGSLNQRFQFYNQTQITRGSRSRLWVTPCMASSLHCCLLCYLAGVGVPDRSLPFGITYNCLADGGDRITLIGTNFGVSGARFSVNNRPCMDVQHLEAQSVVSCTISPGPPGIVDVTIAEGFMPGLTGTKPFLSYASTLCKHQQCRLLLLLLLPLCVCVCVCVTVKVSKTWIQVKFAE